MVKVGFAVAVATVIYEASFRHRRQAKGKTITYSKTVSSW